MIDVASNLCQISLAERTSVVARFNKMGRYVYHLLGTLDCTLCRMRKEQKRVVGWRGSTRSRAGGMRGKRNTLERGSSQVLP